MKSDNALVNSGLFLSLEGGDTGRGRAEHRNFLQLWFTHYIVRCGSEVAQLGKFANLQVLSG